jgi:hypothetical protein
MAGPIPSWRGISIRRSHLGIAASMIVKGFGRLPKDWLVSHSRLPHRAASSGVVVNHLPSKLPTVGRNIPDFTMSSTSSGLTARYKRTHSSSSCRAACRAPRVSAAPPPARSSAAFSIPTPSPPSARGNEAKSSISSAIWANSASHKHFQECEALQRSIRAFRSLSRLLMCFWLIRPSTVHSWMIRTNSSTSKLSALSETFLTKLKNCE